MVDGEETPRTSAEAQEDRVVRTIGLGMLLAIVPALVHNGHAQRWLSVGGLVLQGLVVTLCLILHHRGARRAASRALAVSAVMLAAVLQVTGQRGVHDVALMIFPAAILVGGALLDRRWFIGVVLLAMATLAAQYGLELSGTVRYPTSAFTEISMLVDAEIILAMSALAVGLLMGSLRASLGRSRAATASLQESEELYRTLFNAVNEAVFVHEAGTGAILDANAMAERLFGYDAAALRATSVADLSADEPGYRQSDALARLALAAAGTPQVFEWRARARDGRVFWTEVNARSALVRGQLRLLVSARDIDERKRAALDTQRLEEQLREAQRLESIGRLAGGVAHDFNNLLTCITGNVDLATDELPAADPLRQNLDQIRHAAVRAAELTGQLLAFSLKQPIAPRPLDLSRLLVALHKMLSRLLGENVALTTEATPELWRIHADPGQVEQMLMNLAVNARDAMPLGGRLTIRAEAAILDEAYCAAHGAARPGEFVCVRVTDTGVGMDAAVREHLFEPFFTTKPRGRGTGLGLAMVFGAMQQNSGFIEVDSELGRGSTFALYFPACHAPSTHETVRPVAATAPTGSERVLLVEDDEGVRQLGVHILQRLGYRVTACASAEQAAAAAAGAAAPFALLVTDVVLPGRDGRGLAAQLTGRDPALRVLFCSGYPADVIARHGVLDAELAYLAKPFTAHELAVKVRAVLDA